MTEEPWLKVIKPWLSDAMIKKKKGKSDFPLILVCSLDDMNEFSVLSITIYIWQKHLIKLKKGWKIPMTQLK